MRLREDDRRLSHLMQNVFIRRRTVAHRLQWTMDPWKSAFTGVGTTDSSNWYERLNELRNIDNAKMCVMNIIDKKKASFRQRYRWCRCLCTNKTPLWYYWLHDLLKLTRYAWNLHVIPLSTPMFSYIGLLWRDCDSK